MSFVVVAALQTALAGPASENTKAIEALCRDAANRGAHIILPPELFEGSYFPQSQREELFKAARPVDKHPTLERMAALAGELDVVIPVSFFERDGPHYYNSVAVFDRNGDNLGVYRKSHIPDGPGYQEKFYFRPGNTGFRVFKTGFGTIGIGICWDQWFPECARIMALQGADLLFYPTAIGSEPHAPGLDTREPWKRVMIGHAVANAIPIVAANRTGTEGDIRFYGNSFVADHRGELIAELDDTETGLAMAHIDLDAVRHYRASFGFFRDRRPDLYTSLCEE